MKLDGSATVIEQAALKDLKARLRGPLLLSGDAGYDQARRVLNESIDRHPALVIQPTGVADVQSAVNFARERELLVAVKCGGHSPGGKSTCDKGMQIDLSRFRGARVDPEARRAYVDGGSLLGDMDHETMALGLVTTAGTVSHTGVGGLTLGGGFGRLARRFGLALDNVQAVDIVTADGQLRHASPDENPDLYWGVRGGGGNFGIVTNFEFGLHPMQREVVAGSVVFPIERARELLGFYGEYSAAAPDELYVDAVISAPRDGQPGMFILAPVWSGPAGDADRVLAPLTEARHAAAGFNQGLGLRGAPARLRRQRSAQRRHLPEVRFHRLLSGRTSRRDHGRVQGGPETGHRALLPALRRRHRPRRPGRHGVPAPALDPQHAVGRHLETRRRRQAAHGLPRKVSGPGSSAIRTVTTRTRPPTRRNAWSTQNYQGNIGRMRQVKKKYDPMNLFRLNANVQPA